MKLWQKEIELDQKVEQFTIGKDRELDMQLAAYDVIGSLAHCQMLGAVGLLTTSEMEQLLEALQVILKNIQKGHFQIEAGVEDIHSQIELELTRTLGPIGKKIHSGRSRNDQVLVDLKLFFRDEIKAVVGLLDQLFTTLIEKSHQYRNVLMPGYTHLQVAMVSSFGLWFSAYAETLIDDARVLNAAFELVNQNPLGSAAGFGTSFPIDRKMTTDLLGFSDLNYNAMAAQMGRGKVESVLSFALASIAQTLAKLAMDICLYCNQNYAFIQLPETLTTGSSIMPHKKNPDVFELIRAKCNKLQALPNEVFMLINNLPSGYHRDFQLLKESLFPAIEEMKSCLSMTSYGIKHLQVNENILQQDIYQHLFTVEKVNELVLEGLPFREAYQAVGIMIKENSFEYNGAIQHQHEGSIGNLCLEAIKDKWEKVKQKME